MIYRVLSRKEQFATNIFRILTDEVAMPDGRAARRDYMVHIGAVGVVALDEAGRVVLVHQYRHALGRAIWELPAGLVDVDGEPLHLAAARELAEEADLRAARWDLLADAHTSPGVSNELIRIFLARDLSPVPLTERHRRTHEEAGMVIRSIDLDEAVGMALAGEITNAACLIGVLGAAQARERGWATLRPVGAPLPHTPLPEVVAG
jgi:ADP-ribose pyrophosphatase